MYAPPALQEERTLALPLPIEPAQNPPFPLVASIAPLVASGAIWALTHSPFALIFAALSPIVAVAGMADGRWHSRRKFKRDRAARNAAINDLFAQLIQLHEHERAQRLSAAPVASAILNQQHRMRRWTRQPRDYAQLTLGTGTVLSAVRVTGEPGDDRDRRLVAKAQFLDDAPVTVDASLGIGIVGPVVLTRALARGYLVQLMQWCHPQKVGITIDESATDWHWARAFPHAWDIGVRRAPVNIRTNSESAHTDSDSVATIALAETVDQLPVSCHIVVAVRSPASAEVLASPAPEQVGSIVPELITQQHAAQFADELASGAHTIGIERFHNRLPDSVAFAQLKNEAVVREANTSLSASIGVSDSGDGTIDLVANGPHAIVGGTTGSGKSELLITWVSAMASRYPSDEVTFLLVDFKGGSAFTPLAEFPHCVGLITDLGHGEANRALRSLKAEIRRREKILAGCGARDIADASDVLPRLVIVVDEFAAMLEAFPELNAVFVDIAARGRSLGMHTILCTQRPAGVVRDAVLANCALRLTLRVHSAADSAAVIGTDAAAQLGTAPPGRCILQHDGIHETIQIAVTAPEDRSRIATKRGYDLPLPARPWLDPLPAHLPLTELCDLGDGETVVLGMEDIPEEQSQLPVLFNPRTHSLLVMGVQHSGKSTLIASMASQWAGPVIHVCRDVEALWHALDWGVEQCDNNQHGPATLLLLDDLDALVARVSDEYQTAMIESLTRVLRDGSTSGVHVIASVHRMTPILRMCGSLFGERLILKLGAKDEHVLAGAPGELFDDELQPGGGVWHGRRIQLVIADTDPHRHCVGNSTAIPLHQLSKGTTLVIARNPIRARERVSTGLATDDGGNVFILDVADVPAPSQTYGDAQHLDIRSGHHESSSVVLIGDPESWMSSWAMFSSLRHTSTIIFDGCSPPDVRSLLRSRQLPPLAVGADRIWVQTVGGELETRRISSVSPKKSA